MDQEECDHSSWVGITTYRTTRKKCLLCGALSEPEPTHHPTEGARIPVPEQEEVGDHGRD